jgi:hypothetical protein
MPSCEGIWDNARVSSRSAPLGEMRRWGKTNHSAVHLALVEGSLEARTSSVGNGRSEICWVVVTPDDRFASTTNYADGAVSRFGTSEDGSFFAEICGVRRLVQLGLSPGYEVVRRSPTGIGGVLVSTPLRKVALASHYRPTDLLLLLIFRGLRYLPGFHPYQLGITKVLPPSPSRSDRPCWAARGNRCLE